jgi:hypothetical protein
MIARLTFRAIPAALLPLALAGCAMSRHSAERLQTQAGVAIANNASSLERGRSMFRLGEYGLAIEAFRRAAREAPDDSSGYNGLAASYDMIGRFDLSRRNYELALAVAPDDARIYRNMARSLEMQGDREGALALRNEADRVAVLKPVPAKDQKTAETKPIAVAELAAAPALPPPVFEVPAAEEPAVSLSFPKISVEDSKPVEKLVAAQSVQKTITLRQGHRINLALESETVVYGSSQPERAPLATGPDSQRLKLVRMDNGEMVVRSFTPLVRTEMVRVAGSTPTKTVIGRRVSIALSAPVRTSVMPRALGAIRIMNAGGRGGLAKRTQERLALLGWNRTQTGDSDRRFAKSWVVYPASQARRAMALKRQLPFETRALIEPRASSVVLLLGRNAAAYEARVAAIGRHG